MESLTRKELRTQMLPDVLAADLRVVFCGTAAGKRSAELRAYYAGPGNKFWRVLKEVGLTPRVLAAQLYADLLEYGIGLTDLVKMTSGMDNQIDFTHKGVDTLRNKILRLQPKVLCFNGKRAAKEFLLKKSVDFGPQPEVIGVTKLFVAPSTSGAANGFWDVNWWYRVADLSRP